MRIAIVSDVHEDVEGLRRVLKKVDRKGYDRLVCLGDVSGFSEPHYKYLKTRDASGCLSMLRERNATIIAGNHDYFAAKRIPPCSDVFCLPWNWYEMSFEQQEALVKGKLWLHETDLETGYSEEELLFLKELPEVLFLEDEGLMFSHYAYPNHSGIEKGFYSRAKDFAAHFEVMEKHRVSLSFIGHSHVQGSFIVRAGRFREYGFRRFRLRQGATIVGVPPLTKIGGFCIFEGERLQVKRIR